MCNRLLTDSDMLLQVRLWNLETNECDVTLSGHKVSAVCLIYSSQLDMSGGMRCAAVATASASSRSA